MRKGPAWWFCTGNCIFITLGIQFKQSNKKVLSSWYVFRNEAYCQPDRVLWNQRSSGGDLPEISKVQSSWQIFSEENFNVNHNSFTFRNGKSFWNTSDILSPTSLILAPLKAALVSTLCSCSTSYMMPTALHCTHTHKNTIHSYVTPLRERLFNCSVIFNQTLQW